MPARPERTCVGCRTARPKGALVRVVGKADGQVALDLSGRTSGRGAYLCPRDECLDLAVKRKALERALKRPVPRHVIEELRVALNRPNDGE
jgi:uncharacterized protein